MITLLSEAYISASPVTLKDVASTFPEELANTVILKEIPSEGEFLPAEKIARITGSPVKGKGVWIIPISRNSKRGRSSREHISPSYREVEFRKGSITIKTVAFVGKNFVRLNGKKFPYRIEGGKVVVLLGN